MQRRSRFTGFADSALRQVRAQSDVANRDREHESGTDSWILSKPARAQEVEGYASPISTRAGDPVSLMVNVDGTHGVRWELYRVGYYGGHGARFVATGGPVVVDPQPSCPVDPATGLIECPRWGNSRPYVFRGRGLGTYTRRMTRKRRGRA